jgi:hypothetical protein
MDPEGEPASPTGGASKGGGKDAAMHYAWNAATRARQAEIERHGGTLSPTLVAVGSSGGGGGGGAEAAKPAVGSAWNAAQTWEERDVTATALEALGRDLREAAYPPQGALALHVTGATLTGKATLIASRGKVRLGYECELAGKWEVREGAEVRARGTLSASLESEEEGGFCDGLKVAAEARLEGGIPSGEASALVKLALAPMKKVVKAWEAGLKAV